MIDDCFIFILRLFIFCVAKKWFVLFFLLPAFFLERKASESPFLVYLAFKVEEKKIHTHYTIPQHTPTHTQTSKNEKISPTTTKKASDKFKIYGSIFFR